MSAQGQFLLGPLANIGKNIFQAGGTKFTPTTLGAPTIGQILKNFFAGLSKPKVVPIKPKFSIPKPSTGTKLLVGTGLVTTGVLGTELFLTSDAGQRTLDSFDSSIDKLTLAAESAGETFEGFTNFFSNNPIVLPLLIGLGLVLVVKS